MEALIVTLRDKLGVSVELDDITKLNQKITYMLENKEAYKEQIRQIVQEYLYHPGRNGEAGGRYIIQQLENKKSER